MKSRSLSAQVQHCQPQLLRRLLPTLRIWSAIRGLRGRTTRTTLGGDMLQMPLDHVQHGFKARDRRTVGRRLHFCGHLGGLGLFRRRHRCLCPENLEWHISRSSTRSWFRMLWRGLHARHPGPGLPQHTDHGPQCSSHQSLRGAVCRINMVPVQLLSHFPRTIRPKSFVSDSTNNATRPREKAGISLARVSVLSRKLQRTSEYRHVAFYRAR